jgi:hypothetical protein
MTFMQAAKKAFKSKRKFRMHLGATHYEFMKKGVLREISITPDGLTHSKNAVVNIAMLLSDAWEVVE